MTRLLTNLRADPTRIDADLADELNHHIAELTRHLESRGLSPDAASLEARRRFGDQTLITRRCRAIILKEQTMLRRLHLALTITLAALLVLVILYGVNRTRRAQQEAHAARAMEMQARMMAEQARDNEQAVRKHLEDSLSTTKPPASPPPPAPSTTAPPASPQPPR